ncbi:probable UTR1 protein, associated with ferric reductase activity [Rhynchosporium agropyri]|uniref:Probable UTR1 protein, associated with ferric reductase activity n=1 Tax=Rhynchosporium agropyri TaxID=914238 RepID=A0A1E1KK25_9HELO|nr:probable UTR1 protein, associated with ferric reductase activity [Rhynchosporium agropyri]
MSSALRSPASFHPALTNPDDLPLPIINEDPSLAYQKDVQSRSVSNNGLKASGGTGDNLLRENTQQLGPLNTRHSYDFDNDPSESSFSAASTVGQNSPSDSASLPASPAFPPRPAKSPFSHRKNALSVESVPRQSLIKALAASSRNHNPRDLSLPGMVSSHNQMAIRREGSTSQRLSAALTDLAARHGTPTTPRFNALQSPCFYHERFDDVLNIDKVLEEIRGEEWMSHSRLLATATGVREISKQLQRRPIKRAVRNVMIVTKARDNQLVHLTRELATWLMSTPRYGSELGVNVYVDAKLQASKRFGADKMLEEHPRFQHLLKYWKPEMCRDQPEKFDLVLTLGGDGTVLYTSWLFQGIVPPILSFSLGSLGFLTNFEYDKFKEQLNKVMGEDGMRVSMRMRFTCTVYKGGATRNGAEEAEQFEVLNELVIDRGPSPYVSSLELYGDDELLTVVQADGCIFATPTGSTAYSLSAGGSLVHPDIPAILLTPICPHTLSFRPMVLSDTMLLRVSVPRNSRATAYCSFDGKNRVELKQGDHITIAASQYPFPTVMKSGAEWFDSVSTSLKWNTRGAAQKGWDGLEENQEEETEWDIDFDDSAYGTSEETSTTTSPLRKKTSSIDL